MNNPKNAPQYAPQESIVLHVADHAVLGHDSLVRVVWILSVVSSAAVDFFKCPEYNSYI